MVKPIRILQVLARMNRGGAETMIMNLYRNIDREKVQFDFLVHTNEKCAYDDEIVSLGGNIYRVPQYNVKNHFTYKKAFNDFFKKHKEYKLVHCHMNSTAAIIAKIAKKNNLKIIVHSHNISYESGFANRVKEFLQIPLKKERNTNYRFACGKEAGKWLFGKCDFKVLNNAIDTSKFIFNNDKRDKIRNEYGMQDKFVIGNIARFNEQKNHVFLIDIFNEIYKKNENAVLMLVGDGSLRKEIEDKVAKLGLTENVIFTGVKSNINELLMAMDVFLFPSLFEGLPVTMIEAQATGVKCVVSNTVSDESKITDLVEFIPLEKPAEYWAEKVLSHNNYKRNNMQNGIEKAGYDIKTTAKWVENFYLENWER